MNDIAQIPTLLLCGNFCLVIGGRFGSFKFCKKKKLTQIHWNVCFKKILNFKNYLCSLHSSNYSIVLHASTCDEPFAQISFHLEVFLQAIDTPWSQFLWQIHFVMASALVNLWKFNKIKIMNKFKAVTIKYFLHIPSNIWKMNGKKKCLRFKFYSRCEILE